MLVIKFDVRHIYESPPDFHIFSLNYPHQYHIHKQKDKDKFFIGFTCKYGGRNATKNDDNQKATPP